MTHPSVEEVAEHLEGSLAAETDERVRAHLDTCAACTETARQLAAVPDALRAAAVIPPPMPEHLAERVQDALADEARQRGAAPGTMTTLDDRRRRRRRRLGSALVAAAAVVVVGIGVSQVVEQGGSRVDGAAGSAELSEGDAGATAGQGPRRLLSEPDAAHRGPVGTARATLIAEVAAAHDPDSPRRERADCVAAALGDLRWSGASYSVPLAAVGGGDHAGAVVVRPSANPSEGVLVSCAPDPVVLLRRALR